MQSQISYLTAILNAGFSHKILPNVDISKANWNILNPFFDDNHLQAVVSHAISIYHKHKLPIPSMDVCMRYSAAALNHTSAHLKLRHSLRDFVAQKREEGHLFLALGGEALSTFYPASSMRGGDTMVCIPLYQNTDNGGSELKAGDSACFELEGCKIVIPNSVAGSYSGSHDTEADTILHGVFSSGPCDMHPLFGIAYPNPTFLALYHLYTAQKLLLNAQLPFEMLIDWATLLHTLSKLGEDKFNWASFFENVHDLGLTDFASAFSVLAVRMTGIDLPEAAASLVADEKDVDYLLQLLLSPDTVTVAEGRISRFIGALRNADKYRRFSASSSIKEAFYYLFK